jgi:hypothetical protein
MSKRLFIWIGLIVLIGVIAAAGWSLYTTLNRPAAESPPPVARGKIPQVPATTSGKVIHRARIPKQAPRQPVANAVPGSDTREAASPAPSARISPGVTFSSANESATRTETANPVQPAAEPEAAAPVESPTGGSTVPPAPSAPSLDAGQPSDAGPAPSDTPVQDLPVETPSAEPATAPEAEPSPEPPTDPQTVAQAASDQAPDSPPPAPAKTSPPSPAPAAQETAPPPKPQIQEPYTIQVGAYRNKVYAEAALASLARKGYDPYIFKDTDARSRAWYAVRFGRFATRQAAQWALSAYRDKERKEAIIARTGVR